MIIILVKRIRVILGSQRAETSYFSTMVFVSIAVLLLVFIVDLFSIISMKQELDYCADETMKQIQLSGSINSETDEMFRFLCSQTEGAENITYSVDAIYHSPTPPGMSYKTQLGTPFYITIEGSAKPGNFWDLRLVHINIVTRGSGVSEHYWK